MINQLFETPFTPPRWAANTHGLLRHILRDTMPTRPIGTGRGGSHAMDFFNESVLVGSTVAMSGASTRLFSSLLFKGLLSAAAPQYREKLRLSAAA